MNETPTSNQTQNPGSGKATEPESIAGIEKERKKHYCNGGSPSTTKYNLRESRKNLRLNKVEGKP